MFRPFNPNVLIGNWYEDRVLEEDVIKDYLEKRENGSLRSQQHEAAAAAAQNLSCPINQRLSTVNDGRVHIDDTIMLKCDSTREQPRSLIAKAYRDDCFLSMGGGGGGGGPCGGGGGGQGSHNQATGRSQPVLSPQTTLVIKGVDGSAPGTALSFGQPFAITTQDGAFFLQSDTRSYDEAARKSRLQTVKFQSVYNHECDWVATCLNPKFRLEAEGNDIPANDRIIILHMKTNKALGVVTDFNHSSCFEIVAHTFLDSHKAEEDQNHWRLCTNLPPVDYPTRSGVETGPPPPFPVQAAALEEEKQPEKQ